MYGVYAQFEELLVAVAVGLALECFDFVVETFQRSGTDGAAVVVQQAGAVEVEGVGHLDQHREFRRLGASAPVVEEPGRGGEVLLVPEESEFLFHVVGGGQRLVDPQGLVEPLAFGGVFVPPGTLFGVEVLGVFEEEPAGALEHGFAEGAFGFAVEFASEFGEAVVEEFDDVEVVEDVEGFGQVPSDGEGVGGGHVGGDGFDLGVGLSQAFPEGDQGVGAFSLADEDDGAAEEIEDDGEVAVAVADGDLVDGEASEFLEFGFAEASVQVAFEEVFDGVPTDLQVLGDGSDGHVGEQAESVAFEGVGEAAEGFGDPEGGLADDAAIAATEAWHRQAEIDRGVAEGARCEWFARRTRGG